MSSDQKQEVRVHIRWMIRRDMLEVLNIEAESFEFPWLEEDFIRCLRQRNCIGMVAEHEDRVVGFMVYELNKTRLHVLNFAVAADCRRLGVGSRMIGKLVGKLSSQRRSRILLEVRETNLAAQLFFRENGFRAVSVLRDYYEDTPEDAYLMQYRYRPKDRRWPNRAIGSRDWPGKALKRRFSYRKAHSFAPRTRFAFLSRVTTESASP